MKAYNTIRETSLLDNWCRIIKRVEPNQPIPESFEKSLQYFNLSTILDDLNYLALRILDYQAERKRLFLIKKNKKPPTAKNHQLPTTNFQHLPTANNH
ncbi:hypothetical protein BpHYR1_049477 [Brachionus plicatilis]|uniref:Uncharacterized protein n=1 Tax=Brachionus plicatilis TaxID=10195 RepID=A0A3M7RDY5_BRAPC|nr:hypothetical protein BpHYR1_049477 [Brachionus plicatilis]